MTVLLHNEALCTWAFDDCRVEGQARVPHCHILSCIILVVQMELFLLFSYRQF